MSTLFNTPPLPTGYLLLFRNTNWCEQGLSENEMKQAMEKVVAWFDGLAASGKLLGAQPLFEDRVVISGRDGGIVTDGPFVEAKESVGGYALLAADSLEEAVAIAKSNPMHALGLTTEVRTTASTCPQFHRALSRQLEAMAS